MIYTAEMVTECHPDKICDQVADGILDRCLMQDNHSRVAVEVLGGHGVMYLVGEITTKAVVNYGIVAKEIYFNLTGKKIRVVSKIVSQAPEIAQGVNGGGAGDQGVMVGYACHDNEAKMPHEIYLAKKLLLPFEVDGKSQVTIEDGKITNIVLSVQGKTQRELSIYVADFFMKEDRFLKNCKVEVFCNNTGSFDVGGFDADTGCTGRKIVIDQYGPRVPVGGGSFSGKDATKVDRSAAYMARYIALQFEKENPKGSDVLVQLAYAIGKAEPVMAVVHVNGLIFGVDQKKYDCRPEAIIERFGLRNPIYLDLARNGHFGRKNLPWEKI
jgi:S-adenosylmethionine synthetase